MGIHADLSQQKRDIRLGLLEKPAQVVLDGHFIVGAGNTGARRTLEGMGAAGIHPVQQGFDVYGNHRGFYRSVLFV